MDTNDIIATAKWRENRAKQNLKEANDAMIRKEYENVVIKSYYSVFFAMQALNILKIQTKLSHKGALIEFNKFYVKDNAALKNASKYISQLRRLREKANYEDFFITTNEDASKALSNATDLLDKLTNILEQNISKLEITINPKPKLVPKVKDTKTKTNNLSR